MFVAGIENKPNNYYYAIQFSLISRITWSSKSNMIFIYFLSYSSELLFLDLTRYLILLHVASYVLRLSLISSVEISVISSCVVDNSISNVVDKNLFLSILMLFGARVLILIIPSRKRYVQFLISISPILLVFILIW